MTSKQIDSWLRHAFPGCVIKTNISGCPFFARRGFPDYHIVGIGFVEIKRGNERLSADQKFWLNRLDGFVYRFWDDHIEVTRYLNGQTITRVHEM